jgi:ribokinase
LLFPFFSFLLILCALRFFVFRGNSFLSFLFFFFKSRISCIISILMIEESDDDMAPNITVVGSICVDFGLRVPHLPAIGETVLSTDFTTPVGGKGFNQALQAHRLGSSVHFFGRIGDDPPGQMIMKQLDAEDFPVRGLRIIRNENTAIGLIFIGPDGKNMIGGYSGANMKFTADEVDQNVYDALHISSHLILQLEIPDAANLAAMKLAKELYVRTVMNFAPYREIPPEIEDMIDIFVFNEIEASAFFKTDILKAEDVSQISKSPRYKFEKIYIVTLGEKGAAMVAPEGFHKADGIPVNAIDSTGAGDSFTGAYVHFVAWGESYIRALDLANVVASDSTTKLGAMPSLPGFDRMLTIFDQRGIELTKYGSLIQD